MRKLSFAVLAAALASLSVASVVAARRIVLHHTVTRDEHSHAKER